LPQATPSIYIYANFGDGEMVGYGNLPKKGLPNWLWNNFSRYWQRIGHLYLSLQRLGHVPALCFSCPNNAPVVAIYPYLPDTSSEVVLLKHDPLAYDYQDSDFLALLSHYINDKASKTIVFGPGNFLDQAMGIYMTLHPKVLSDWLGLGPEVAVRLIARLTKGRHIF
jgi:hypothetical protein